MHFGLPTAPDRSTSLDSHGEETMAPEVGSNALEGRKDVGGGTLFVSTQEIPPSPFWRAWPCGQHFRGRRREEKEDPNGLKV